MILTTSNGFVFQRLLSFILEEAFIYMCYLFVWIRCLDLLLPFTTSIESSESVCSYGKLVRKYFAVFKLLLTVKINIVHRRLCTAA